jgi:hypothetical protein
MQLPLVMIRAQLPQTPSLNIPLWSAVDPAAGVGCPEMNTDASDSFVEAKNGY